MSNFEGEQYLQHCSKNAGDFIFHIAIPHQRHNLSVLLWYLSHIWLVFAQTTMDTTCVLACPQGTNLLLFLVWLFLVCDVPALDALFLSILVGMVHSSEPARLLAPRLRLSGFLRFFFSFLSFFSRFFFGFTMGPWESAVSCSCTARSCVW